MSLAFDYLTHKIDAGLGPCLVGHRPDIKPGQQPRKPDYAAPSQARLSEALRICVNNRDS